MLLARESKQAWHLESLWEGSKVVIVCETQQWLAEWRQKLGVVQCLHSGSLHLSNQPASVAAYK